MYSNATREKIDVDRNEILFESSKIAEAVIETHKEKLKQIVDYLCDKEIITETELTLILGEKPTENTISS